MMTTLRDQLEYRIESAPDHALIGPRDSRIHELDTTSYPYNTICHLERDFGDGRWIGCTGTLISPNLVLTAAHCLFSHLRGGPPVRVRVIPGRRDRDSRPYGVIISRTYFVPCGFVAPSRRGFGKRKWYDYGLIVLPREFVQHKRFMPVTPFSSRRLNSMMRKHRKVTIAGYPGDRPKGTLWRHSEKLLKVTGKRLYYSVDTCPGHSGSPIWIRETGRPSLHIIGIHTTGLLDEKGRSYGCAKGTVLGPPGLMNSGVRITASVFKNIIDPGAPRKGAERMILLP